MLSIVITIIFETERPKLDALFFNISKNKDKYIGVKSMINRERTNGIYIMISDEEKEIINKKFKLSGCKTLRQFILKCILEREIFVLDMNPFREMSSSIGRTTGSINQIAKRTNQTSVIYKEDIDDLKKLLKEQNKMIVEMRKKLFNISFPSTKTMEKK